MATASLGRLTLDLLVKLGSYEQGLNRAERQATQSANKMSDAFKGFGDQLRESLGGTQIGSIISDINTRLDGMKGSVLAATAGLAGMAVGGTALAVGGLTALAIQTAKADAEMAILANRANIGITNFQILAQATQQLGISQDQLGSIFADVQEKLGEFSATGAGGAIDFFDALKNNTKLTDDQIKQFSKTLQGKDGVEAVQILKDKLDELGASSQEQRFVFESLASDLGNLLPLFADGGELLEQYGDALVDAGVIKSKEAIQQSQLLAAQTQAVNLQYQGAKDQLVTGFTPALVSVSEAMFGASKNGIQLTSVGSGLGTLFKSVAWVAIGFSGAVQLLGDGLGSLAAMAVAAAKRDFAAVASIYRDSEKQFDNITADIAARLDKVWAPATESTNKFVAAQVALANAAAGASGGIKTNTVEAKENAKAIEAQTKAAAKLKSELQVNAKVQSNAAKYGFSNLEDQYKLPTGLLSAINMQESRGNANAIGPMTKYGQAKGGFQFLDGTAKRFGLVGDAVFNTGKSAEAAAKYFSFLYGKFGTWEKAISAYHAGEGNVERGTGLGPINREYVKNVMGYMDAALKGVGTTASDAVRYVEDAYKAQQSIFAKYMTEREQLEAENAAAIQEIQKAFIEGDPNRQKYLDLQKAVYAQDLKDFTENERLKREEAWRTLDEIQSSMMESRVNSLAAASMSPDQLAAWQRTNIQQDGFSQLGDDFNNGVSAIEQNEFLTQEQKNAELLALHDSYLSAKAALTQEYAKQDQLFLQEQQNMMLNNYSGIFGSITDITKNAFGEQSAAYAAAFAIQKGFAVAQSVIAIQQALAMAAANPFPMNLAAMATVAAQTASIVANITGVQAPTGMAHNGIDNIPKEGTWLLDGGERVLNPEQNKDLTNYLSDRQAANTQNQPMESPQVNVRVMNSWDDSEYYNALAAPQGEKIVMNIIKRNRTKLGI